MIISTMAKLGLDTRVSKTDSTGTKTFKRAGVGVTAAVLSDGAASYTPGISEKRGGASTFFSGGIKNTDTQTDASQAVTASRLYDAFGNVIASTGTWKSPFGNAGKFGYQEDPDTGLKLLGHRYYDSSTGRFLIRDPAKAGRNWYGYCGNSPVGRMDATGYEWHDPVQVIVDPEYASTVIAFGDFSWQKGDGWRACQIDPGFEFDPRMDVDFIMVVMPDGRVRLSFLPGKMKRTGSSRYRVDKNGIPIAITL